MDQKSWTWVFLLLIFNKICLIETTLVIGKSNQTIDIPINVTIPHEEITVCLSLKFDGPVHNTQLFGGFLEDHHFQLIFDFGYGWLNIAQSLFIFLIPEDHEVLPFTWTKICFSSNDTHYHVAHQGNLWYQAQRSQNIQRFKNEHLKKLTLKPVDHFYSTLQIWSTFQSPSQLMETSAQCQAIQADLFDLDEITDALRVYENLLWMEDVESDEICLTFDQKVINAFTVKLSFDESLKACQKLGGQLHFPGWSHEDYAKLTWPESEQCTSPFYWIPLRKLVFTNQYLMMNTNQTLEFSKDWPWTSYNFAPNGGMVQECIAMDKRHLGIDDLLCESATCFFCEYQSNVLFSLRGLCENSMIDHQYVMKPSKTYNNFVTFQGFQQSLIRKKEGGVWQIIVQDTESGTEVVIGELNTGSLQADQLPIGMFQWTLFDNQCRDGNGTLRELKLTTCPNEQYTCYNGDCIELEKVCDENLDCLDGSDENNCKTIQMDIWKYRKHSPPSDTKQNRKAEVEVHLAILSLSNIDEVSKTFESKFHLKLKWLDHRLDYLYIYGYHNLLSKNSTQSIWLPSLTLSNTISNLPILESKTYDVLVSMDGQPAYGSRRDLHEAMIFSGNQNHLVLTDTYDTKLSCTFELNHYPFDSQRCQIEVTLPQTLMPLVQLVSGSCDQLTDDFQLSQFKVTSIRYFS